MEEFFSTPPLGGHPSRRTLMKVGLGALAAPAVLRTTVAGAQSRVIKIGHVSPRTGPLAGFGEADPFILEQVRMSILLHKTERAYIMCHSDCATYGGLAAFKGDREVEAKHHCQELERAAGLLKDRFPDLQVECFFVNFEGVFAAKDGTKEQVA